MNDPKFQETMENYRRELDYRLENDRKTSAKPVFAVKRIDYDISDKTSAIHCGGIGLVHSLVKKLELPEEINKKLNLLKENRPYHESDHILNLAYNIICGGKNIEAIDLLRNNIPYMDAIGAKRIPAPTTAGDFIRRPDADSIETMMDINIGACQKVYMQTDEKFRKRGILDVDSTIEETYGECKENMDISYNGKWGFNPLAITEATTGTHLAIANRSGNVSSDDDAVKWMDKSIAAVRPCFEELYIRGDSGFRFYGEFDRWDREGIFFCLTMRKHAGLVKMADSLGEHSWKRIGPDPDERPTAHRKRKTRVKENVVVKRGYENKVKHCDHISEFNYQPGKCKRSYRVVVVRRTLKVKRGQMFLFDETEYFFYINNIIDKTAEEVYEFIRGRSNHENKIEQLKNGVFALKCPAAEFTANWAYMVICMLAWNMKAWVGMLSEDESVRDRVIRMEFPTFLKTLINIPCQIVTGGRYVTYRFLNRSVWLEAFMSIWHHLKRVEFSTA